MSLGFSFDKNLNQLGGLSSVVGVALAAALRDMGAGEVRLKWPNDVIVDRAKLCGILIELRMREQKSEAILGMGVNVDLTDEDRLAIDQPVTDLRTLGLTATRSELVVGLIAVTSGSVLLDNEDLTNVPMYRRARRGIGYLPQEPSVFRKMTVEQNIRAIVETLPLDRAARASAVETHLNELGLTHLASQKAYTLSGGERRRLEISRALVTRPKFLLMDEPFSGVDPISVSEVQKIIIQLKERGIGVLITDHNVRETLRIVDRAYLLHEGSVLSEGTGEFLINDPKSKEFYLGEDFNM